MATNMYIKIDDVVGEATDANHKTWIEILGWSHGFSQPGGRHQVFHGFHD